MSKTYYIAEAGDVMDGPAVSYYYHSEKEAYDKEALLANEGWGWSSVVDFTFEDEEEEVCTTQTSG